jgi:hypothetical protein
MKAPILLTLGLFSSSFLSACGSSSGTQPHAMSAAEHEAAAQEEARTAESHQAQFDPAAKAGRKCQQLKGERGFCWTSEENPTAAHEHDAERHRELAEKHRAAQQSLATVETQACTGIPEEDRDRSPFSHPEDIRSVAPLREEVTLGRTKSQRTAGAQVVFAALPGMTAEWLQRLVDCHVARNSVIGHETASTEMPHCPLTLRGVTATVSSTGDGFAVAIRSDDDATSQEILRRAEALKGAVGG